MQFLKDKVPPGKAFASPKVFDMWRPDRGDESVAACKKARSSNLQIAFLNNRSRPPFDQPPVVSGQNRLPLGRHVLCGGKKALCSSVWLRSKPSQHGQQYGSLNRKKARKRFKLMKALFCFLLGLVAGIATYWYVSQPKSQDRNVRLGKDEMRSAATNLSQSMREKFDGDRIKDELARTGKVIREKANQAGDAIADATANARVTAAIKGKLLEDSGLAAFKIDVDTTDGVVTLSGTVSSHDEIGRAVDLALATDGVRKVVSTLQVKP
jgi:osmotically-inducible protein OsmY